MIIQKSESFTRMRQDKIQSKIFRTPVQIPEYPFEINYNTNVLTIGSCFAQDMALRMQGRKLKVLSNPMGIQYNPRSIVRSLNRLLDGELYRPSELYFDGTLWHSWDHHGSFSGTDKDRVLSGINRSYEEATRFINEMDVLILTFGTSLYYVLKKTGQVVSNCHKAPAQMFEHRPIDLEEMRSTFERLFNRLKEFRPGLKVILTISPVRHLRDGLIENNYSKSLLNVLVHQMEAGREDVVYFPSYEILLDELRDYRFYAEDMTHPSKMATDYIWELFKVSFMKENTLSTLRQAESILKALNHRPLHPRSARHQAFLKELKVKMKAFENLVGRGVHWDNMSKDFF